MNTALWIALRYLRTKKGRFAAFITWVSLIGLALGVLVLTVVISVMNGFDTELRERILGTVPHVLIENVAHAQVADTLAQGDFSEVAAAYEFFVGAGMVTRAGAVNAVTIYGINARSGGYPAEIDRHMHEGSLAELANLPNGIVVGAPLANHLGVFVGDSLALILTEPSPFGIKPRLISVKVAGTFELGAELDYSVVLLDQKTLAVSNLGSLGSLGVRLTLTDPLAAQAVARRVAELQPDWIVTTWSESFGELFQAVRLEKLLMFLTLLMVVAVATFNIVSGQMMLVNDRRADIAILRTMGAAGGTIRTVFLLQGLVISSLGIAVGLALGVVAAYHISTLVSWAEHTVGFSLLEGTYFVAVPSVIKPFDLMIIGAMSWLLCLLSAWLPAARAARMNPIEGLH